MAKRDKRPNAAREPQPRGKSPRGAEDKVAESNSEKFSWRADWIDLEEKCEWNFRSATCEQLWKEIMPRLHDLETQTWGEVYGKRDGSTHPMPVANIATGAQDRLKVLDKEDYDNIFQINIRGGIRIWGIRDRKIFYLMWFDPNHTVYVQKKDR